MSPPLDIDALWSKTRPDTRGLVPCVTQDLRTRAVLMMAWVSREALEHSLRSGYATYWSRSRGELWEKGKTSGNRQKLVHVRLDCDGDTLVYLVEARLPACHEGTDTCFSYRRVGNGWVREPEEVSTSHALEVEEVVEELDTVLDLKAAAIREASARHPRIRASSEAMIEALERADDPRVVAEAADLVYELAVALKGRGLRFREVLAALDRRLGGADGSEP